MEGATLKQMRSLAAVERCGSIAAAARTLHVSPPAVGQQLKLLERAVGMPVVERTPSGLRVTDAGRVVLDAVRSIEIELTSCRDMLDQMRAGTAGHVALGAVSTAKYFAPHVLAAFWQSHPEIEVTLKIGNRDETIEAFTALEMDLCIMGRPPTELDLVTHEIGPHPHVVIARPGHPLGSVRRIRPQRLASETFLIREQGSGTRSLTESLFASLPDPPKVGMEIASNETIKQAVMAGLGLALISADTVASELADGRLVVLDVDGTPVLRHWYVLRHAHAIVSPAAAALWEFLVTHCAGFLPSAH